MYKFNIFTISILFGGAITSVCLAQNFSNVRDIPCPNTKFERIPTDLEALKHVQDGVGKYGNLTARCDYDGGVSLGAIWIEDISRKGQYCNQDWYQKIVKSGAYTFFGLQEGYFEGLGVEIQKSRVEDDFVVVANVLESSPAQDLGIKKGDRIYTVNNKSLKGLSLETAVKLIRGKAGESKKLHLLQTSLSKRIDVHATLRKIYPEMVVLDGYSPTHAAHAFVRFKNDADTFAQDKAYWKQRVLEYIQGAENVAIVCSAPNVSEKGPVAE